MKQDTFGPVLRQWRRRRRMSQLDLGLAAEVSARHISFIESGRSRPSRQMVSLLSEALDVPLAVRNGILAAAGFAPAYRSRPLAGGDMEQVRQAIDWILTRHEPYPALVLDRRWKVERANAPARMLLAGAGLTEGDSLLDALCDEGGLRTVIANWPVVAQHMLSRIRTETAHFGGDPVLDEAAGKLSLLLPQERNEATASHVVLATDYRAGERILSFFSTVSQFGAAEDIAVGELKIELLFPANEETRRALGEAAA